MPAAFVPQLQGIGFDTVDTIQLAISTLTTAALQRAKRTMAGGPRRAVGWRGRPGGLRAGRAGEGGRTCRAAVAIDDYREGRCRCAGAARPGDRRQGRSRHAPTLKTMTAVTLGDCNRWPEVSRSDTATYVAYPDHVRVETRAARSRSTPGVRRRAWLGEGSARRARCPAISLSADRRRRWRATRSRRCSRARRRADARLLPDAKDACRRSASARGLEHFARAAWSSTSIPRRALIAKQAYVAAGPAGRSSRSCSRDYRPSTACRSPLAPRYNAGTHALSSAASVYHASTRRSIPRSSNARPLDLAPAPVVRRAVRRSLRGRPDA